MAVTLAYKILLLVGLPALNLGLLSDYKICGDSECESPMSRVQAIRDYHGRDCRFLSFQRGETIFVYHKLTGKREDLWAGSIDKQFGYFPKDAVQVEHVHTTKEKVVETQDSDFFCMDEFGSIVDSSHLDSDEDGDEKSPNHESATVLHADGSNFEGPSVSDSTEPPESAPQADDTMTEENKVENAGDSDAVSNEESQEATAAPDVQGGSGSAPWLGSSVTGWLGLNTVTEPDNLAEVEKKDEIKETPAEASLTSSVTGWLGWGGEGEADESGKSEKQDGESADSLTSTVTGWLGFGAQEKTDQSAEKEQDDGGGGSEAQELAEKFRSRRMSLDLEGSQLREEEKEEMGTLEWLGTGLTNRLGFGQAIQESPHETDETSEKKEEEEQASWFGTGIGNILGYKKEADPGTASGFKDKEEGETQMEETPEDQKVPSETESTEQLTVDSDNSNDPAGMSNNRIDRISTEGLAPEEDQGGLNPQSPSDENSQSLGGSSSVLTGFSPAGGKEEEVDIVLDDDRNELNLQEEVRSLETQEQASVENVSDDNKTEERKEEEEETRPHSGETDQGYLTQSDVDLTADSNSVDSNLKSAGQSAGEAAVEKTDKTHYQTDNADSPVEVVASVDDLEDAEKDFLENDVPTAQTDESAGESQVSDGAESSSRESRSVSLSDVTEETKDDTLTAQSGETNVDHLDLVTVTDDKTGTETNQGELVQEEEMYPVEEKSQEFGSSHSASRTTENMSDDVLEQDRGALYASESTTTTQDDTNLDSEFSLLRQRDGGAEMLEKTENADKSELQPIQTPTTLGSEGGTEEVQARRETGESKGEEEVKTREEQQVMEEGKQEEEEVKLKEEETLTELQEGMVEGQREDLEVVTEVLGEINPTQKQEEHRNGVEMHREKEGRTDEAVEVEETQAEVVKPKVEEKQEAVEELNEEEKRQQQTDRLKEEEKREELKEADDAGVMGEESEVQEAVEEVKQGETQEEVKEVEERHPQTDGLKEEKHEELKEEEKREELKELDETTLMKEEKELQETLEELKENEKPEEVKEAQERQQQAETFKEEEFGELKEEAKREELKEEDEAAVPGEKEAQEESDGAERENRGENSLESAVLPQTSAQTERIDSENPQVDKGEGEEESNDQDGGVQVREKEEETVGGEGKAEDMTEEHKCYGELCPQAGGGHDSSKRQDSIDSAEMETAGQRPMTDRDHILTDKVDASHTGQPVGTESNEDSRQEEEQRNDIAEADERKEGQDEANSSKPHPTGNEDVESSRANSIPEPDASDSTDYGVLRSEVNGDVEQLSSEASNLPDDNVLQQEDKNPPNDSGTGSLSTEDKTEQIHSNNMMETAENDVKYGDEVMNADDVVPVIKSDVNTVGSEFGPETGSDISGSSSSSAKSQSAPADHAAPQHLSDDHNKGGAEAQSRGAFGLFKSAFGYFRETESSSSSDSDEGEAAMAEGSQTPEQEVESAADQSARINAQIPLSQQQPTTPPPSQPQPNSASASAGSLPQTKTFSRDYKNLLAHVSEADAALLVELFGRHKLQFLDYILGASEPMAEERDHDESILMDIENLLYYHMEGLVAPGTRLVDTSQEDEEEAGTLIALRKLETLLARVSESFNAGRPDASNANHQDIAEPGCVGQSCVTQRKDEGLAVDEESSQTGRGSADLDAGSPIGTMRQIQDFVHQIADDTTAHVHAAGELLVWLSAQVVSALPDDIRPGPDLYGVPWEPIIISGLVGLISVLLFTCRCYSSVKSRLYRNKERWMAEQVAQQLDEKCKVLETLSNCQQEHDELENSLKGSGLLVQTQKTDHLESEIKQLGHAKKELQKDLDKLKDQLDQQREYRKEQERRIIELEESMKSLEEETKDLQSQDEQAQTTLKIYNMNSDRLNRNLETAGEENTLLLESNAQLKQEVEGWAERVGELEAEMNRCQVAHSAMLQDVANKDERIMSLTDRLLSMKAWDSDLEEADEGAEKEPSNGTAERMDEVGKGDSGYTQHHLQKVQKLIYAAKLNADLKSVDEDKDRAFAKLNDEIKAKEDLQESIKELEKEKLSLQSESESYTDQVQRLQQKLHIMTEMYQENELKLHRMLTVEEKERLQKEEKLNKADKNIALAMEELNNYRQRATEMEEELEKTNQSYQTQISAHEKKAHNNWLAARAAERELSDIRRENALLRQKLTETQLKLDTLDKDPYTLDSLARPLPFRAERSPYGPSPLGRPASETRAFLSPPTLMDGPPNRLSPRVPRGPLEPPGGHGEMERIGGPHSDSGSGSPTWERDRRGPPLGPPGPLPPPGYMFPEPGGPVYRRPPPPPGPHGFIPPPGPLHPRGLPPAPLPHPLDMADGTLRENSFGPGEQEHRESLPEGDPRMVGPPPPGPRPGPMDGPFPRRAPYGPPPPEFYPPRGPGGPPMMPMWAPPPPGAMFPPRFPPGGPHLPPNLPPHMRPPPPDGLPPPSMGPLPPQQTLPSPPHSQSQEEHTPSPEDAI